MGRKDFSIPSKDGVHKLHVILWEPESEVKAVVQISHGMIEMIERYEDFALFLNKHGYAVIGNDHLGHGLTAGNDRDLGYFCPKNMSATVVADLHRVTKYAKKKYIDKPYILLGHSMGSFMARRYIMTYGNEINAALIVGTGSQRKTRLFSGKLVANILKVIVGDRYRTKLLKMIAFGTFQKRISNPQTQSDWISRDENIVDFCVWNKYCNFIFTVNGYRTLFDVLTYIQKYSNIEKIPKDLPLYFMAGGQDPVGHYSKDVIRIADLYKKAGIHDISLKIYPDDRHEILNELDKAEVYSDIISWLETKI